MRTPAMKEVKSKRNHVLSKAQYDLTVSDIKKLLNTLQVLTICSIPTWRTQWKAYSESRTKLLADLEQDTILTAGIEDYEQRRGAKVQIFADNENYLAFSTSDDITLSSHT